MDFLGLNYIFYLFNTLVFNVYIFDLCKFLRSIFIALELRSQKGGVILIIALLEVSVLEGS